MKIFVDVELMMCISEEEWELLLVEQSSSVSEKQKISHAKISKPRTVQVTEEKIRVEEMARSK